jgi:acetylornithine deacetylase
VVCGPGSMDQGHTANEYIELSQIAACEDFLGALAGHLTTERTPQP